MTGSNKNDPDRSDGSWTNKQTKNTDKICF